jgi:hypothetical protein
MNDKTETPRQKNLALWWKLCHCRRFNKGKSKICEITKVTGIAKSTLHEIVLDLNFHREADSCVQKKLTEENKS